MISKSRRSGSVLLTLFFLPGTLFLTSRKKSPTLSCVVNPALSEPMPANVPSAAIQNSTIIPAVTGTAQTARLS